MRTFEIDSAMQRLAERRIEQAMREGKFDNLPGRGRPVDLDDMPVDENARMVWWALRMMRNAGQVPPEVEARKRVDSLRDELRVATSEERVRALVGAINTLARQVNSGEGKMMRGVIAPADLGAELGWFHQRRNARNTAVVALAACRNRLCASANSSAARFCRRCGMPTGV